MSRWRSAKHCGNPGISLRIVSQQSGPIDGIQHDRLGGTEQHDAERFEVTAGGNVFTQVHDGQSGYLSQSALPLYFGLDVAEAVDQISVLWPSGQHQVLKGPIPPNQQLVITETDGL